MNDTISFPKKYIEILDQVFEIEKKLESINESNSIGRNVNKIKEMYEYLTADGGLIYQNPLGEPYNETRTDLEASIAGKSTDKLVVTEVIKPIIRWRTSSGATTIARKGVVIVESKS
jgi:benzoyl-CoA reductase/2-hydroxyglutaryl-CoA dehydratase subunit BcrC/BadD/HgdB